MFTLDTTIDMIQTAKKEFVNTVFANHEKVADALNQFVDAQTAYTKSAAKAGTDVASKLTSEATKAVQDIAKFDYAKAVREFTDTYSKVTKK